MDNLKILHWNSNGINHKQNELQALASSMKIDIILLNETRLSPTSKLKLTNYHTYRTDLPPKKGTPAHGGTAILIHRRIVHQQEKLDTKTQSTTVRIKIVNHEVLVTAIYKPPNATLESNDLNILTAVDWFITAGDFNAKYPLWHSRVQNTAGRTLSNHIGQNDYTVLAPDTPTYYPFSRDKRPDVLDIALIRLPLSVHVTNLNELSSDHNPILLEVNSSNIASTPPTSSRFINWKKYSRLLSEHRDEHQFLNNIEAIDTSIRNFSNLIHNTIEACVYSPKGKKDRKTLPTEILNEIKEKNRLRREWQRTRDPQTKRNLNAKTRTFIRTLLQTHRQDEWNKFLDTLETTDGSLYKLNKCLLHKRPADHPLNGPNGLVFSPEDKSELLADSLAKQFTRNPGPHLDEVSTTTDDLKSVTIRCSEMYTTPGKVQNIIKKIPKRKAPGEDQITNTALKFLPLNKILSLTNILNRSLRLCYFPTAWKKATIICLPKVGKDPKLPENYRPIALLSSLSKLYEKILEKLKHSIYNKIREE